MRISETFTASMAGLSLNPCLNGMRIIRQQQSRNALLSETGVITRKLSVWFNVRDWKVPVIQKNPRNPQTLKMVFPLLPLNETSLICSPVHQFVPPHAYFMSKPEDGKKFSKSSPSTQSEKKSSSEDAPKPLTNWEKFKDMYKKYWYVLIPVHGILSVGFMVVLYYLVKSGLDVVPLLEKLGVPENFIEPIRKSGATAYVAAAYAIYHLISPLRYAVTLGITTVTITYLRRLGYIRPVPSSKRIQEMYNEGRDRVQILSKRLSRRSKIAKRSEK